MGVFVKEPLVDWKKLSRRLVREQEGDTEQGQWFAEQKIEIAKRKLGGDNPAYAF